MYEVFLKKINEKVSLTTEEEEHLKGFLTSKKLRRRQYFLREGDVCRNLCMVEKGALRTYYVDQKGIELITAFAFEGWTMGDLASFLKEEPSMLNIEALEEAEITIIKKSAHETLLRTFPKYETYFRILMTDAYIALQARTTNIKDLSPDDRYIHVVTTYPEIISRIPQHMIASYMGFSPETLSRIRHRVHLRK
ncbi:MAG: Crp/Fnr family transcriptional regulator [Pedobacter sp.]|nr:MAG: Crp/Fnr family transcriptional regulator [Pedobacter sp.]